MVVECQQGPVSEKLLAKHYFKAGHGEAERIASRQTILNTNLNFAWQGLADFDARLDNARAKKCFRPQSQYVMKPQQKVAVPHNMQRHAWLAIAHSFSLQAPTETGYLWLSCLGTRLRPINIMASRTTARPVRTQTPMSLAVQALTCSDSVESKELWCFGWYLTKTSDLSMHCPCVMQRHKSLDLKINSLLSPLIVISHIIRKLICAIR